jgi:serine/threonine-protein kinase ULK/ATG1
LVFDYCNGGTLTNCLELYKKKYNKPFSEDIAQYILKKVVDGLYYLHKSKIIHRDLKLDNILVSFNDAEDRKNLNLLKSEIKIIDFGFARYLNEDDLAQSVLGSPINMDPQILQKLKDINSKENFGYDLKVDIWSLGTIAFEILIGVPPFDASSYNELLDKINKGIYNIPASLKLSKQSISFLNGLLQHDPKKRLGIEDIIYHEFLTLDVSKFESINLNNSKNITLSTKDEKQGNFWSLFETPGNEDISKIPAKLYSNSPYVEKINERVIRDNQLEDYLGSMMQYMGDLKLDGIRL